MPKVVPTSARHAFWALLVWSFFTLNPASAMAESLPPATEVTARYTLSNLINLFKAAPLLLSDAQLSSIEPASGGGAAAAPAEGAHGAAPAEGGHGPKASGKSEGQKSFSGKVIGAPPPLPKVTIGGRQVISQAASLAERIKETTPESLSKDKMQAMIARRFEIRTFTHNPQQLLRPTAAQTTVSPDGVRHVAATAIAPISVIEFVDLSCGQCMAEVAQIDAALQDISATIMVTHVHAPTGQFQDTNMPAFYGKVASRAGLFWQYRAAVVQEKPVDANAVFDLLVKSGVDVTSARTLMLNEARRFYRELDADALLARTFGVSHPPVLFVNGIRVGENGIPLEQLPDVLKYVDARIQKGLPEPPK